MFLPYFTSTEAFSTISFNLVEETMQTFSVVSYHRENIFFFWLMSWLHRSVLTFLTSFLSVILLNSGSVLNSCNRNSYSVPLWLNGRFYLEIKVKFWLFAKGIPMTVGLAPSGTIGWTPVSKPYAKTSCNPLFLQYLAFLFIILATSCLQLRACSAISLIAQA